uniref:Uncharacterized protein n=1 Tax=Romanomermis culicivorax TaxID=13658 RepID=A0A915I7Q8_ROMCU
MGTKSRERIGVNRVTLEWNQEKMWRCLQFEKGRHTLKKWWLGGQCHFEGPILATGSDYDSEMTRVVVCGGQNSGGLWWIRCHNLTMRGSGQLTMGSGPGYRVRVPWGPKQKSMQKIEARKAGNQKGTISAGSFFRYEVKSSITQWKDFIYFHMENNMGNELEEFMDEKLHREELKKFIANKFAIIELLQDIEFNEHIKPISLFDKGMEELLESKLFTATDYPLIACDQSVEQCQLLGFSSKSVLENGAESHVTVKQHMAWIEKATDYPLIACDQSVEQCQLLGFSSKSVLENGAESHITVKQHMAWIEKVVTGQSEQRVPFPLLCTNN